MPLYHFTNCLLVLAILVLLYMSNGPKVIITTNTVTISTTTFSNMLLI